MSGSIAQSLGILYIIFGGQRLNVDQKSSSFSKGGLTGKPVMAGQLVTQAQEFMPPMVKASFPLVKGMSISTIQGYNNTEMQIVCDSGQTYTSPAVFLSKDPTIKGGAGNNVSCEWSGQPFSEVVG